ncbi:DNA primase/helicase [Flavobacterium phage vB_FspP_elemoA_1-9C]|jgi:twinkle protein|uniref:DNA primase/helicase n=2 Tax=Elemovirus TaxID=2948694 RepID=A0A7D7IMI0_9CAUD|nr:DNA primase/helicase [Flavobacterium phage vB_FspP_elemoD_13-5B]YP_010356093.1 DNA primase/helicase [Flavobacterium phage vB_FspP_elemoB_14-3B]QMP84636.1 DNA primase/helicase [Flavobacterium phage vB_FspP_elemoA_13-1A]QMP84726.1 DNA primase/helicase [Flavobacterium phage vB_FspP_elemoC_13-1C]QMP85000.1 DNA primase/helicase [Flavobacterium phage vB_FspP_elemoA_15-9B]QMP85356.1 DNA primase/helicase [Flavobacterium phage vB_FspP_elemoA_8-9C]QMP85448.1 DNA primase/helicase [Flavobacterium phag
MNKFIDWNTLDFRKTSGKEKMRCPSCDSTRSDKKDKSLLVDHNSGYGKCFYCESLTFKEVNKVIADTSYTLPNQDWFNYTELSDKIVKYLESRGISQTTAINLGITEEDYYQPSVESKRKNIVFNYFEGDVIVNKKYRTSDKKFTQSTNGKSIFYNINSIINEEECYIVEGEFDVLAVHQVGIKNVISVPNGANDNDKYWLNSEKYLKNIKKFYIATDNDEKGDDLADKIAQRLGRWRCERINFKGKDANEDLINSCLLSSLSNRTTYPVAGTHLVNDLIDDINNLYDNGFPDTIFPKHHSFGKLKDVFSVMRGHLVVGTGIPSHGKSNFTEWYVLNLISDYKMKASFYSPEHHPFSLHHATFMQKVYGKNFFKDYPGVPRISKSEINRYKEWANNKIYLTAPDNSTSPTWGWLLDRFKEQMICYGIDIFVIDAFNKLEFDKSGNKLDQINEVLTKLTTFAQMNNVIIFLIAHPTKMKKSESGIYESPTLYDVSGSSDFRNQTHDGYCIYRNFDEDGGYTTFTNLKTKMTFQGEIGAYSEFQYDLASGRYYDRGTECPTHCLIDDNSYERIVYDDCDTPLPTPTPDQAFGPIDINKEIPF